MKAAGWAGVALAVTVVAATASALQGQGGLDMVKGQNNGRARNVIFFVGDGMGVSTVTATRVYSVGVGGQLVLDQFPHTALSRTSEFVLVLPAIYVALALRAGARLLVHSVENAPVDDEFLELAKRNGTVYNPTLVVRNGYRQLAARNFDDASYGAALACVDPATRAKAFLSDSLPGGQNAEALS